MKTLGLVLAIALCLLPCSGCREKVRIHTEVPVITEEVVICTRWVVAPWIHTVCGGGLKGATCHTEVSPHLVPVGGSQRARVTRTVYSWNYADAKPDELPQLDVDRSVSPLESCQ